MQATRRRFRLLRRLTWALPLPVQYLARARLFRDTTIGGGARIKQFEAFRREAERALDRLDAATSLPDVANFPGHRLEKLSGDRVGSYSIRVNDQ